MCKISIIVPVYNSSLYLDACLSSINKQTFENFECILVNDGSTDDSEQICREWCRKDTRFKLICQINQGSSVARNIGLDNSKGDYIAFVDSDDWIDCNFLRELYFTITTKNCEVAFCDLCHDAQIKLHPHWDTRVIKKNFIFHEYLWGGVNNGVVNKLYKKSIIADKRFPVGANLMEDASWTPRVMESCLNVARISDSLYNYRTNPLSMVHTHLSPSMCREANLNRLDKLEVFFRNLNNEEDYKKLSVDALKILKMIIFQSTECYCGQTIIFDKVYNLVKSNYSVFDKYIHLRTERCLLLDILHNKSLKKINKRLRRNLVIDRIIYKLTNV